MKRMSFLFCILILIGFISTILVSCDPEGNTVTFTFTYIDTIEGPGEHDGETLYAKLTLIDCLEDPVVWGSTVIADDAAVVEITDVPEDTYICCAFIDVNGNAAGDGSSMPDSGDYSGQMDDITITADDSIEIDTANWIQIP